MNKDLNIVLEGIVGSQAYGLANEDSDTDLLGVFVAPTKDFWNLNKPKESIVKNNPDVTYHEVEKYIKLATKCNPTITELLWLDEYIKVSPIGQLLIDNRQYFLSNTVRKAYGGYALSQIQNISRRQNVDAEKPYHKPKHIRHTFRLLIQGTQLLKTGELNVKLSKQDKEKVLYLQDLPIYKVLEIFEEEFKKFDNIESLLPDKPDLEKCNNLLHKIRLEMLWKKE